MRRAVVILLAAGAVWSGSLLPPPWGPLHRAALAAVRGPALAISLVLVVAAGVWLAPRRRGGDEATAVDGDEPMLRQPAMMPCRSARPIAVVTGLTPGAGASTIAFNLAVTLAVDGRLCDGGHVRACRPVCLLRDGAIAEALDLRPRVAAEYLAAHSHRVDAGVVNLATRHPSGCELLCLPADDPPVGDLPQLVAELARRYDAVVVDGGLGERRVLDVVVELAEALILVGLAHASCVSPAGRWIELVWALGLQDRTGLLVNRVSAGSPSPRELQIAFLHGAELPDDPRVARSDREGVPWSLDRRLAASRHLAEAASQIFPALLAGRADDAA